MYSTEKAQISTDNFVRIEKISKFARKRLFHKRKVEVEIFEHMLFSSKIKKLREEKKLLQRQLATVLDIDTPSYSKIERGDKKAKREHLPILATYFNIEEQELLVLWLADAVYAIIDKEECSEEVIEVVKNQIKSHRKNGRIKCEVINGTANN